jgi:5,10-methylenetetrahydromethanopterin reductase
MSEGMLRLAGELCDGVLPLLFPPENFAHVHGLVAQARPANAREFDFAACIWVSIDTDRAAARRVLAAKIAYYGHAMSPLIYERLGVPQQCFRPIEHAVMVERDEAKAISLVTDDMLRIGVVGDADDLVARLTPIKAAGAAHISFGPPLGPNPAKSIEYLGRYVLPQLR